MLTKKTKDVLTRKLFFQHPDYQHISAVRCRDSTGRSTIAIFVGDQTIEFGNHYVQMGDGYEMQARALGEVLDDACNDTCMIPKPRAKKVKAGN